MKHPLKAPSVGESVTEVSILKWRKSDGEAVKAGEIVLEIESDKATVEVISENSGILKILKNPGDKVPVGSLVGEIDPDGAPTASAASAAVTPAAPPPAASVSGPHLSPAVHKIVTEQNINPSNVSGTGKDGRITKGDVIDFVARGNSAPPSGPQLVPSPSKAGERRVPMSNLRLKIAERLVHAQHTAAILTTFNEVDMTTVMEVRNRNKDAFKVKHGVPLSFMSFFTKASCEALKAIPEVNAFIDGKDVVYHDSCDVGIAVGTERGLVVPVVRGADKMNYVEIERAIGALAVKARDGKLSIADMTGGTFTISNGGTYGSLMSTPILNPPQSGILGMHKIQDRPMAVNGAIAIRPMMYLALSYDHRIIDGKGAVTFLIKIREYLENPKSFEGVF